MHPWRAELDLYSVPGPGRPISNNPSRLLFPCSEEKQLVPEKDVFCPSDCLFIYVYQSVCLPVCLTVWLVVFLFRFSFRNENRLFWLLICLHCTLRLLPTQLAMTFSPGKRRGGGGGRHTCEEIRQMSVKWANNRYHRTQARLFLLTSSALARGEPPFPNNVLQHNVLLITRDPYYT